MTSLGVTCAASILLVWSELPSLAQTLTQLYSAQPSLPWEWIWASFTSIQCSELLSSTTPSSTTPVWCPLFWFAPQSKLKSVYCLSDIIIHMPHLYSSIVSFFQKPCGSPRKMIHTWFFIVSWLVAQLRLQSRQTDSKAWPGDHQLSVESHSLQEYIPPFLQGHWCLFIDFA